MYFVLTGYRVHREKRYDEGLTVLQESPFSDMGSISELFDDVTVFMDLRGVIDLINQNAMLVRSPS